MKTTKFSFLALLLLLCACSQDKSNLPIVITSDCTVYQQSATASCNGFVESDGGSAVIERGICYAEGSTTPDMSNKHVSAGSGKGSFSCQLTNLQSGANYSYRAYAINSKGTAYGNVRSFIMNDVPSQGGDDNPQGGNDNPQGGNDNPQGENVNEQLKPILGTYRMSCTMFDPFDGWGNTQSESWSNIRIYPNTLYGELGVSVEGLYEGNANYGACGKYAPNKGQLILYADTHTGLPFPMIENYDNNTYTVTALFTPRSYDKLDSGGISVWEGSWLPIVDGDSIIFDLTAANTLTMGNIPNTSDAQVFRYRCVTDVNVSISYTDHIKNAVLTRITGAY